MLKKKRGQVWVETVIYTLIAFILIGAVLSFAKPKIDAIRDQATIEQSIDMLKTIENTINEIGVAGNKRKIELGLDNGILIIDGVNNFIRVEIESKNTYSEPGINVNNGNIIVLTTISGDIATVTLTRYYNSEFNIKYKGTDEIKQISESPVPYKLFITNAGEDALGNKIINIEAE